MQGRRENLGGRSSVRGGSLSKPARSTGAAQPVLVKDGKLTAPYPTRLQLSKIFGAIYTLIACAMMAYALFRYHQRASAIRRKAQAYDDRVGPTVLCGVLISASSSDKGSCSPEQVGSWRGEASASPALPCASLRAR